MSENECEEMCSGCAGSGEGMYAEGSCMTCGGSGVIYINECQGYIRGEGDG